MNEYFENDPSDGGGEARVIGGCWLPTAAAPESLSTVFGDVGESKLILESDWKPVTLKDLAPPVKNQNGIGACCSFDPVLNIEYARNIAGLEYVALSPGDLYRVVSGGVDEGSLPERNLKRLMEVGTVTEKTCPPLEWQRKRGDDAERANYRILEAYWCPTFAHAASALQQGFTINANVWWWKYDSPDADGWMAIAGTGRKGGHSICGIGLANRGGQWGIQIQNSWGTQWSQGGFGFLPYRRCEDGCKIFQWWATRGVVQESGDFPTPKV